MGIGSLPMSHPPAMIEQGKQIIFLPHPNAEELSHRRPNFLPTSIAVDERAASYLACNQLFTEAPYNYLATL